MPYVKSGDTHLFIIYLKKLSDDSITAPQGNYKLTKTRYILHKLRQDNILFEK